METLTELQARHRKEQKDLQSRITSKKKNASKKTRKGVNSECEDLERQLKERQAQELSSLNGPATTPSDLPTENSEYSDDSKDEHGPVDGIAATLAKSTISTPTPAESETGEAEITAQGQPPKKRNRAKERLARRAAETASSIEAARLEALSQPDIKAIERAKISSQISANGLVERLIRPDGHCLFSAVADQLQQVGVPLGGSEEGEVYKVVRSKAAGYMEGHPGDFEGFLEEPLETYVQKIRETAEWGGHLELMALSKVYGVEICVLQDGPMQTIEPGEGNAANKEKDEKQEIWLAYYRHGFGLGEHYNSLRKAP